MAKPKIVLAYSGGLDTTVAVPWLQEKYDADIITLTIDLGMVDLESIRQRALSIGAVEALTVNGIGKAFNCTLFGGGGKRVWRVRHRSWLYRER